MLWHDLAFLHWSVNPDLLRPFIPAGLVIDTWQGQAWLGIVPFRMAGVCPRRLPARRCAFAFPELNVRTYVRSRDRDGVWFFSLDATSWLSVRVARAWYGLPYFDARISFNDDGQRIRYASERTHRGAPAAALDLDYGPCGPAARSLPGTLEHWLTERYALYSADRRGAVRIGEIDHHPWLLQPGWADIRRLDMTRLLGFDLPDTPSLVHFARELDAVAWSMKGVGARNEK